MKPQHSPTPFILTPLTCRIAKGSSELWEVFDANNEIIATAIGETEAKTIVQACNAHEALVDALKDVRVLFKEGITTEMIDAALKLAGEVAS